MLWIKSDTTLLDKIKLKETARRLRLKPVYLLGHLHALWHAAMKQQEDGDLSNWNEEMIAIASSYSGNAPQYVLLLQEFGWLDGRLIHDWLDYAGTYLTVKYSKNTDRLKEIWKKHGRTYGTCSQPTDTGERKITLPISNRENAENLPSYKDKDLDLEKHKTKPRAGARCIFTNTITKEKYKYLDNADFESAWLGFLDMRKKIRKPATDRAKEMLLEKLHKYPVDVAIKMLNQSELNSWQDVFELRQQQISKHVKSDSQIEKEESDLKEKKKAELKEMEYLDKLFDSLPQQDKDIVKKEAVNALQVQNIDMSSLGYKVTLQLRIRAIMRERNGG